MLLLKGRPKNLCIWNKGLPGKASNLNFGDLDLAVSYGSKEVKVPFSIKLNDFIMDQYPGTNSASSYASEVTLLDPRNNMQYGLPHLS